MSRGPIHAYGPCARALRSNVPSQKFIASFLGGRSFSSDMNSCNSSGLLAPEAEICFSQKSRKQQIPRANPSRYALRASTALGMTNRLIRPYPECGPLTHEIYAVPTFSALLVSGLHRPRYSGQRHAGASHAVGCVDVFSLRRHRARHRLADLSVFALKLEGQGFGLSR